MKKDKDGNWVLDEEDEAAIEIGAMSRVRADEIREERAAAKKPCEICGKPKNEGKHGEDNCKPAKKKSKWGSL